MSAPEQKSSTDNAGGSGNVLRSNRLRFYRSKGKMCVALGDAVLGRDLILNAFNLKFDEAAYYYYCASMSYRASSRWRDAGECLVKCAKMYSRMKFDLEAAVFFTEASDAFYKVDKMESVKSLDAAIAIYCDTGRFDAAGRLEREIASIYFILQDWEEAAKHYRKAADFFSGDLYYSQSYCCLEKLLICCLEMKDYQTSYDICLQITDNCLINNFRIFNYNHYLLFSCICLLAIPHEHGDKKGVTKYQQIKEITNNFQYKYLLWNHSKESSFIQNIILSKENADIDMFADHLYHWDNIKPLNKYQITMLMMVRNEIKKEMEIREKNRLRDERRAEKRKEHKKRQERQRKALMMKGIDPDTVALEQKEEMEKDFSSSDDSDHYDARHAKTEEMRTKTPLTAGEEKEKK